MANKDTSFWVVVPFYNEVKLLRTCLLALANQDDVEFSVVLVDNKSTDESHRIAKEFMNQHPNLNMHLVVENQKGTGAAADTGFRYAIKHGAQIIARTDADTMPAANWVRRTKYYRRTDNWRQTKATQGRGDISLVGWNYRAWLDTYCRIRTPFVAQG